MLVVAPAADFLHGTVDVLHEADGWVRPQRFFGGQVRALTSCLAWHPGLFRQMAQTSSGASLRFATDASEVAIAVRMDREPRGSASVLAPIDRGGPRRPHDGVGAVVDGRSVGCALPREVGRPLPWIERSEGMGVVTFMLDDVAGVGIPEGTSIMTIPGLGARHEVTVWLPCLRGCAVRELWCDGTYVEPLPPRPRMLVLGDSIAQGFCADDPAGAWPAVVSEGMGCELLNQSVGGQVFQVSAFPDGGLGDLAHIVVALGANYRWDACPASVVARDARACLGVLARRWPDASTWVLTPTWHDEDRSPSRAGTCWEDVPAAVRTAADAYDMHVVDGLRLMEKRAGLLCDGEHPNARGHAHIAKRLMAIMNKNGGAS